MQDSTYRRTNLAGGYYVLTDREDGTRWLYDSEGTFIGVYHSLVQAANVAQREAGR